MGSTSKQLGPAAVRPPGHGPRRGCNTWRAAGRHMVPPMVDSHRELDWLARRRAGESVRLIAQRAGVLPWEVTKATKRFGPFPPADRQVGRTYLTTFLLEERRQRWIADRRRGVRVKEIAERDGVNHQTVTRATSGWGPYPAREIVEAWVEARRRRRSLGAIALQFGVRPATVQRFTTPHGPSPARRRFRTGSRRASRSPAGPV